MVLKRILITAMGALGLGMLAVGPAFAQDPAQIPAPRLFDDIAKCQGMARTVQGMGMAGMASPLTVILQGTTDSPVDLVTDAADIDSTEEDQLLNRLMFPTGATDCTNPLTGSYQRAIEFYEGYSDALDALPRTDDDPVEESNLERAARLAKADKDAFGGDVYNKVYDVLMAEEAVGEAVDDYNELVGTGGRLAVLTAAYDAISVTDFVDDAGNALTADALERLFGEEEIQGYQAIAGTEFDPAGVLQLEETASTSINTLGLLRTELQTRESTLTTASDTLKAAREAGNRDTAMLEETERRAMVARDHVRSELNRLTAILRAHNFEYAANSEITIGTGDDAVIIARDHRQVLTGFANINNQVERAADTLETRVLALDAANSDARKAFGDAQSYLNQLVTLRQFDEAKANEALEEAGDDPAPSVVADARDAEKATMDAVDLRNTYTDLVGDPDAQNPANRLLSALLAQEDDDTDILEDDDGLALINAVSDVHAATMTNMGEIDTLKDQLTDEDGNPIDLSDLGNTDAVTQNTEAIAALTAMDDPETMEDETGAVTKNADDITSLDGRVAENESDIGQLQTDIYGSTSGQHGDLAACDATGLLNVATCANSRSLHNEADIEDVNDKLMQKKEYIDNLAAEMGVDPVTGEGTGEGGMSRIDMNAAAIEAEEMARMEGDMMLGGRIDAEEMARMEADMMLGGRIDAEEMARMEGDMMLGGRIDAEAMARADGDMALGMRIDAEEMARMDGDMMLATAIEDAVAAGMAADMALGGRITSNADAIASNMNAIGQNRSMINDNRNMIGELSDDLDVVRAGVAASMALAGMPAINGRGIAIGVGSYDGESAFAVGFQIQGEQASFKIGVTSSGGETGASAGVGFNF